uniref:F-box domain-containing protein n=1 Tax=Oryza meridionalis TaxID=40149 RepID=A0A0E0EM80_9ORYZ
MPSGEAKRRRSPAVEPDYLAALPPEIVDNIISRLGIRDVVRTSILSHAWRRRWQSVRGLDLDFRSSDPAAAISSVLKRSAAPVRTVTLRVPRRWFHRAVRWLRLLPRKRVQSLHLYFEMISIIEGKHNLDPSIFSCLELSSLSLAGCIFPPPPPPPPSFVGFLKLTKLSLSEIELPPHGERQLEAMIAASPLLLELSLDNVYSIDDHSERWFVRGANLRSLRIWTIDQDFGCRIGELPRLEDALIFLDSEVTTQVLCKTLEGIAHVERLEFNALMHHQFSDNPPERFSFTFQNLRSLHLHACLDQISSTSLVFSILRCAPNLEKLEIEVDRDDDEVDAGSVEGFANAQTSGDIFPRLRYVWLHSIDFSSNEICFIQFVLSKARSLELFYVRVSSCRLSYQEACIEMAKYKRASPLARLRFIRG